MRSFLKFRDASVGQSPEASTTPTAQVTAPHPHAQPIRERVAEESMAGHAHARPSGLGHVFGRIPVHTSVPAAREKSRDAQEQQADRASDRVMRMPEPPAPAIGGPAARRTELATAHSARSLPIGAGEPLSDAQRRHFEPRFGVDLGAVRLHRGERGARLAEGYHARAFAFGRHVVLGRRAADPDSHQGRALLAHELAHVLQQSGESPTIQCKEEEWSISPEAPEEERVAALVANFKERIAEADAETLLQVQQIFESRWRGREMASMPAATKQSAALSKETVLSEGMTGRMVKQAGEDLPEIFSALMLSDLAICLGIWADEKEAKEKISEIPKDGAEAALDELYTSLPGLVTPPAGPQSFADMGTELTAVESFPFPASIKPKFDLDIPAAPEARPHSLRPRLSVGPGKVFRPGKEIHVRVTGEKSSWIYLVATEDPNADFQTGDDDTLVAEPQLLSEDVRNRDFFFEAPRRPGIYQMQLVSWEQEILARARVIVMMNIKAPGPYDAPPLDPYIA